MDHEAAPGVEGGEGRGRAEGGVIGVIVNLAVAEGGVIGVMVDLEVAEEGVAGVVMEGVGEAGEVTLTGEGEIVGVMAEGELIVSDDDISTGR